MTKVIEFRQSHIFIFIALFRNSKDQYYNLFCELLQNIIYIRKLRLPTY